MRVWCICMVLNISHSKKIIIGALRVVLQYLTGKNINIDAVRVYLHGASISHRVRRSLLMRLGCIRMVLQYLTGKEDHYRCV